jgi:hypothetical protein
MYIVVQHNISKPPDFWGGAEQLMPKIPAKMKLHHTFPTKDGTRAVCVWEAESVKALRDFLEPQIARSSKNEYFQVENKDSVSMPSGVQTAHAAAT